MLGHHLQPCRQALLEAAQLLLVAAAAVAALLLATVAAVCALPQQQQPAHGVTAPLPLAVRPARLPATAALTALLHQAGDSTADLLSWLLLVVRQTSLKHRVVWLPVLRVESCLLLLLVLLLLAQARAWPPPWQRGPLKPLATRLRQAALLLQRCAGCCCCWRRQPELSDC